MKHKSVFSAILVLLCVTLAFSQKQKTRNTLAERQLHGHIAQRTVTKYYLRGNKAGRGMPVHFETTYIYNKDGHLVESRYKWIADKEQVRAVVKFEFPGSKHPVYTKYDSSGKAEETGKISWLNDTTYVTFTSGKNTTGVDTTWLHADYSLNKVVAVYEKAGEKLKDELYYGEGELVKSITENRETGERNISVCRNIVLEKDAAFGNPSKMYIITNNRDTALITTDYRYFAK